MIQGLRYFSTICLMGCVLLRWTAFGADTRPMSMQWQEAPALCAQPGASDQPGVARPFTGILGGDVIVAGGSWMDATGKKVFGKTIYAFDGKSWNVIGELPHAVAEGASAVTPKGIVCVGGLAEEGEKAEAFILTRDPVGGIVSTPLPPLPVTVSMPAAAAYGETVYVLCGKQNGVESRAVWSLRLSEGHWKRLPDIPGVARSQCVAVVQNGDQKRTILALFGGTGRGTDGVTSALTDGYGIDVNATASSQAWWPLHAVTVDGVDQSTIGAGFIAVGNQHALLVGGYNADLWNKANRMEGAAWTSWCATNPPKAFEWNRRVLVYHFVTDQWFVQGELPEAFLPRCGAAVAFFTPKSHEQFDERQLVIAAGEIKPRQRTSSVWVGTFHRKTTFSWISWVVIAVFFTIMGGMAWWFMRKEKSADNYFRGGKGIPWYVVGMSIFATMLSSITFISIPTMTYISDWRYFPMAFCILALAPVVIYYYLPFFCRLNITSAYEYLEKRFNLAIRLFGSLAFNVFMICRVAVVTLLPAIALNAVTGMNVNFCILICGVATIIYCCFGGVEAVIWSDFVQGIILLGGAVVVLCVLICKTDGGIAGFYSVAESAGKLRLWDFRFLFKEPVFWVVVIQGVISNLSSYTSDQCVVQRYITTTDERATVRSIWFNGILSVIASVIFYLIGSALYTHYATHPEMMDFTMPASDSVFPIFMVLELHPAIAGLIIAAIFAATISTLSTNLNSAATSITTDFFVRFRPAMTSRQQVRCGQMWTIVVGVFGVAAALVLAQLETHSLFDVFNKFIAMLTAGLTALFFMGVFMPRIGGRAATVGLLMNYVVCYTLDTVAWQGKPHPFTYGGIGLVVCVVVSLALSYLFPEKEKDLTGLTLKSQLKRTDN